MSQPVRQMHKNVRIPFWLRTAENDERVNFLLFLILILSTPGITVLLSLTVFMLLVAEIMPATSDSVPLIGKNVVFCCCGFFVRGDNGYTGFIPQINGFRSLNKYQRSVRIANKHVMPCVDIMSP